MVLRHLRCSGETVTAQTEEIVRVAKRIHPFLTGRSPDMQGAILADLLATWLAGHPPWMRDEILAMHVDGVRQLVPVNERLMFGERGHPGVAE